jgi:hypothetical protein
VPGAEWKPIPASYINGRGFKITETSIWLSRRLIQAVIVSLLLTTSMTAPVSAQTAPTAPTPSPVLRSYIYGYAPIVMEATRERLTAVPDATTFAGAAPINQLGRVNSLATPDEKLVIRPNADTLYTNAWLDLSYEPMILHLPDTRGRYICRTSRRALRRQGRATQGCHGHDRLWTESTRPDIALPPNHCCRNCRYFQR